MISPSVRFCCFLASIVCFIVALSQFHNDEFGWGIFEMVLCGMNLQFALDIPFFEKKE